MNDSDADADASLKGALAGVNAIHKHDPYIEVHKNQVIAKNVLKIDAGVFGNRPEGVTPSEYRDIIHNRLLNVTREDAAFALLNSVSIYKKIVDLELEMKRERKRRRIYVVVSLVLGLILGQSFSGRIP